MNTINLVGRLTKDARLYESTNGQTYITYFTVATDRRYKSEHQPDTDYINCVAIGKHMDKLSKYLVKGKLISVVGSLQNHNTEYKGSKQYSYQVFVDNIELLSSAPKKDNSYEYSEPSITYPEEYGDEDIPF